MKILITGCAGFIGCHATLFYLKAGKTVIGIDNLSRKGSRDNLAWLDSSNGSLEFYKTDIRDYESIKNIFKKHAPFDLIIHEAAQVAVTTSITDPREDFEINALGTFNLLEATRLFSPDAFFEFASTNKVYGAMESIDVIERSGRYEYETLLSGVNEQFDLDFYSPYGCSKGTADQYVHDYSRIFGLRTVVLRQSCIYGERQFGVEDQGWVAWFVIASVLNRQITIYGDGKQGRDILYIDDLIDAYIKLYHNADKVSGEIYNIGGGPENIMSLLELVALLKEEKIMLQEPAFSDWRPGDQKIFVCDVSKIERDIGWKPQTSPLQGIKKIVEWTLKHKDLIRKNLS